MDGSTSPDQAEMSEKTLLNTTFDRLTTVIHQDESYQLSLGSRGSIAWWLEYQRKTNPLRWQSQVTNLVNSWRNIRVPAHVVDYQLATSIYQAFYPQLKRELEAMPEGEEKEARRIVLAQLKQQKAGWEKMKADRDRIPVNIVPADRWPEWFVE